MTAPTGNEAFSRAVLRYAMEHLADVSDDDVLAARAIAACPAEYQAAMDALTAGLASDDRTEAHVRLAPMLHGLAASTIAGLRRLPRGPLGE